jgi:peptidoglycan/LPS O-acetylase OafA/YrhL
VARRPNACWLGALVVYFLSLPTPFGIPGDGSNGGFLQEGIWQVLLLLFGLLIIAPLSVPNVRSRLMDAVAANPVIRFFGRLSFAIYLWHVAAIHFWFKNGSMFGVHHPAQTFMLTGKAEFWELEAFVLALTVVAALVSRYLFEQPAMRLRDRLVPSGERRTPTPPDRKPEPAARR